MYYVCVTEGEIRCVFVWESAKCVYVCGGCVCVCLCLCLCLFLRERERGGEIEREGKSLRVFASRFVRLNVCAYKCVCVCV